MTIQISNLSLNVIENDLRKMFAAFGEVSRATIARDKWNGRSQGAGSVEMVNDKQAHQAIASLHKSMVDGKAINVNENKYSVKDYLV